TLLYYSTTEAEPLIGSQALKCAEQEEKIPAINHDFKVALGMPAAREHTAQGFPCADGQDRTAVALTSNFLRHCMERASITLKESRVSETAHLIVAEPVSVHSEEKA